MNVSAKSQCRRTGRGFTLIEVMIVVAIVAILAAIAIPSYSDYIRRGKLPEAFSGLSDYKIKMEQFYQDNRAYGGAACADAAVNPPPWNNFAPVGAKNFTFACALTAGGQGFTLTATGIAGVAGQTYTLDSTNLKGTTAFKGVAYAAGVKKCWLVSSAGEC